MDENAHYIVWKDLSSGNLFIVEDGDRLPNAESVFDGSYEECKSYCRDNDPPDKYELETQQST